MATEGLIRLQTAAAAGLAAKAGGDGTRLIEAMGEGLSDVPRERVAGAILITDGQVHDVHDDATRGLERRPQECRKPELPQDICREHALVAIRKDRRTVLGVGHGRKNQHVDTGAVRHDFTACLTWCRIASAAPAASARA